MTSTYTQYRFLTQDLAKTLKRTAAEPQIAREAKYYKDNIGKVTSVDDFLKNDRLYNYAMRAAGLEDMIKSKAFMRKVLTSDLDDSTSFARKLTDQRYVAFARNFSFGEDGKVAQNQAIAQTDAQEAETVGLYSEHRVRRGVTAAADVADYQARIGQITSVDALLADEDTLTFALKAYGIEPKYYSATTIRNVLTSDLTDADSVANKLGGAYKEFAQAFQFAVDGTLAAGAKAQSDSAVTATVWRYYDATGNGSSPKAAAFKAEAYKSAIASVTNVDDLVNNQQLFDYVVTAAGFDPLFQSPQRIRDVLTSDLSDPSSVANTLTDTRYKALAELFSFNTDGTLKGSAAQTAEQLEATTAKFLVAYDDKAASEDATETSYFKARIASTSASGSLVTMSKLDEVLSDKRLYAYLLESYDLDPDTESRSIIERVLKSDPSNPTSFANTLSDKRYANLAGALNFDSNGNAMTPRAAQTDTDELDTIQLYNSRTSSTATDAEKAQVKADNTYYHQAIGALESIDDLVADKKLVAYVVKAFGLDAKTVTADVLKEILKSDPSDPASFASRQGSSYQAVAAAFNFTKDGKIDRVPSTQVQTENETLKTAENYLLQTMETNAGKDSEGVRLALYFRRKAPNINTAFDILADKALLEVARNFLSLPASFSQLDIDKQAAYLKSKLNFSDFKDATKLEKFLTRFGALYDIQNGSSTAASSPAALLFGSSTTAGISESLLSSLQGLRLNR